MPLSETNKTQSQSIEDLIAQLDCSTQNNNLNINNSIYNRTTNRKGKRTSSLSLSVNSKNSQGTSLQKNNLNSQNVEPILHKNIITSKKYTKNLKSLNNRGLPKKNGTGGKHTWSAPGCELADYYLDSKDPNYDSEEADNIEMAYKKEHHLKNLESNEVEQELKPIILEYFQNGDTIEVIDHLKCYNLKKIKPELIAYFIQLSLENNNTCKELMSRLLRDLTFEILNESDYLLGFDLLLNNLPELTLDNPDASEKIGIFIARGIADKIITRKYLERFYEEPQKCQHLNINNILISKTIESARLLVNMNDHLYQLSYVWGNKGGFLAVAELIDKIKIIIQELYDSRDIDDAIRCLKELNVPHFHHELVFEAIDFTLQKANENSIDLFSEFLHKLCQSVIVTYDQLKIGINRIIDLLSDICLDVPSANFLLENFLNKCHAKGFVNENILQLLPNRRRKRFVSEGSGFKIN